MSANGAACGILDRARLLADVAVQKFAEGPLANEADARGVFLFGIGQTDLFGNAAHFSLVQLAHRKQGFGQLRLVQPVQEIALVFAGVQALEQLKKTADHVMSHTGIVASGDFFGPQPHGVVQK